jgi:hypothetical protein
MSFLSYSSRFLVRSRPTLAVAPLWRRHMTVVVERELPKPPPPSKKRWLWTGLGVGAVVWAVGLGAALNHQRLSSSVVHGTLFMVRYDPRVIELVGDSVDYADSWPWISGSVNHLKGKIDIGFKVKGSTGKTKQKKTKTKKKKNLYNTHISMLIPKN